jgi:hypothetical protein
MVGKNISLLLGGWKDVWKSGKSVHPAAGRVMLVPASGNELWRGGDCGSSLAVSRAETPVCVSTTRRMVAVPSVLTKRKE